MTEPKTNAQRQKEWRDRERKERQQMEAEGLARLELWAHPDDHPPIKAKAAALAKKRKGKK